MDLGKSRDREDLEVTPGDSLEEVKVDLEETWVKFETHIQAPSIAAKLAPSLQVKHSRAVLTVASRGQPRPPGARFRVLVA